MNWLNDQLVLRAVSVLCSLLNTRKQAGDYGVHSLRQYTCLHLTKNYGEAKIPFLRSVGRCSRTRPRGRSYGYRAFLTTSSLMIPSRIMFLDVSISPAW